MFELKYECSGWLFGQTPVASRRSTSEDITPAMFFALDRRPRRDG